MKRGLKTEGIIFKKNNLLSKDKLVTIFTPDFGKLKVLAKGVKKITSRRLPHLETGNLIKFVAYKKNDIYYLQESSLISGFYKIKNIQKKQGFLYLFFFVMNKILPEGEVEEKVFQLTKLFLTELSEKEFQEKNLQKYLNTLLFYLGYIKSESTGENLYRRIEEILNEKLPEIVL